MLNLDSQLQILIDEAPNHGVSALVMEKAVIPALKLFALQLQHSKYYLLTSSQDAWMITTLSHRQHPQREKRVIYAFSSRKDAQGFQGIADSSLKIVSIPVTHLLFELFALKTVDSLIFLENSSNLEKGKEIQRENLQNIIEKQMQRLKFPPPSFYA